MASAVRPPTAAAAPMPRFSLSQAPLETRLPSAAGRPRTSPAASSFMEVPGRSQDTVRVGTPGRAFRPARSSADSSRLHGSWQGGMARAGPWSATGASDRLVVQPANGSSTAGPRISESVRLDPPAHWGAPVHQQPGRPRPRTPGSSLTGARGTNKLTDFNMLATACHRAGKLKEEAVAHYCCGVLLDNAGQRVKARECYKRMLVAAQACGEEAASRVALSVAHNRLGVTLHALGEHEQALVHHEAHRALADAAGHFVAHLNLGLAHASLKQYEEASSHMREALRSAIRSGSMHGEAVACGNLSLVGRMTGDFETARACLDRYLQLTEVLADSLGAVEAHQRLGDLASEIGDMQSAGAHFESALSITTAQPDAQKQLNATKIDIGLAQGGMEFSEFLLTQMATSA